MSTPLAFTLETTVPPGSAAAACVFLAKAAGLPKARIKDAMGKGAVWLKRGKGPRKRLRRATFELRTGDVLCLSYHTEILAQTPLAATLLEDCRQYSVWCKPAGMLSQGTQWGDHCSLLRQVELHFSQKRPVFLVHRLDREAAGVVLVAHSQKAATLLSALFREYRVEKIYQAEVLGSPAALNGTGVIDTPLDGKTAVTAYRVEQIDPATGNATLRIDLHSGRLHQIRRHLDLIGHPVLGDPRYGSGNADPRGLRLIALSLRFTCPFRQREVCFMLPPA